MDIHKIILDQIQQPLWDSWYIKEEIGKGASSVVYRIEAKREQRTDVSALKVEPLIVDENVYTDDRQRMEFLEKKRIDAENETTIMYKLRRSPYIVWYEDESIKPLRYEGRDLGYYFLIRMEYLTSVQKLMKAHKFDISEDNVAKLAVEIGSGIKAAHDFGVIHRDIKPGNFFVNEDGTYKLGDFNISKRSVSTRSFAGTEGYIAPEIYRAKYRSDMPYTKQADIYSFGIALYCMMNDYRFPFGENCLPEEAIERRMNGERFQPPKNASKAFGDIIMKACAYGLNERYKSMDEMLDDLKAYFSDSSSTVLYKDDDSDTIIVMPKGLTEEQTATRLHQKLTGSSGTVMAKPISAQPIKPLKKAVPKAQSAPAVNNAVPMAGQMLQQQVNNYQQGAYQQPQVYSGGYQQPYGQAPQNTGAYPQNYNAGQMPPYQPQNGMLNGGYTAQQNNYTQPGYGKPYTAEYGASTYGGAAYYPEVNGNAERAESSSAASKVLLAAVLVLLLGILGGLLYFVLRPDDNDGKGLDDDISVVDVETTEDETEEDTESTTTATRTTTSAVTEFVRTRATTVTAYKITTSSTTTARTTTKTQTTSTTTTTATTTHTTTTTATTTAKRENNVTLSITEMTLQAGVSGKISIIKYPEGVSADEAIWSSSNKKVATVDKNGNVTAVGEGECTITVTFSSNRSAAGRVKITVNPAAVPTSGNVGAANTANGGYACEDGKSVYISDGNDVYLIDQKGTIETVAYSTGAYYINSVGNKLYFCDPESDNSLCSMNKDGTGYKVLNSDYCYELIYYKDWLYFSEVDGENNYVCRMKPDGTGYTRLADIRVWYMTIYSDRIYLINYDDDYHVASMELDGTGYKTLVKSKCSDLCVTGGKIYYSTDRDSRWLYSAELDGTVQSALRKSYTRNTNVRGDYIYCTNSNKRICKLDADGNLLKTYTPENVSFMVIIGDTAYYQDDEGDVGALKLN